MPAPYEVWEPQNVSEDGTAGMEDAELTAKYGRIRAQKTARPYVADKRGEWPYVIQTSAMGLSQAEMPSRSTIDSAVGCQSSNISAVGCDRAIHRYYM